MPIQGQNLVPISSPKPFRKLSCQNSEVIDGKSKLISLRDRRQISLLIFYDFNQIKYFLFSLNLSETKFSCNHLRKNRG